MVTLEQIKQGAARYVDEEFTGKLTGCPLNFVIDISLFLFNY